MRNFFLQAAISLALFSVSSLAHAGPEDFKTGPVFENYGPKAAVETDVVIPENTTFKILFDTAERAETGEMNKTLTSTARFVNMHAAAGVPVENMELAVVVHGGASFDLVASDDNANAPLIAALTKENIRIILCGQSAAYHGIEKDDLLPNIEMALSAMTVHALLQQNGYTLNPF